jgi:ATP adenylyltransferase
MELLFTPWRLAYLTTDRSDAGCIFCEALEAGQDRERLIVLRGKANFLILNRYPYNNGHLMIVPNRHVAQIGDSTPEELHELVDLVARCEAGLHEIYRPNGINVGINLGSSAGAGITGHYHLHMVPRWGGDTNFMTVIGCTRLVPEELDRTWSRLHDWFARG